VGAVLGDSVGNLVGEKEGVVVGLAVSRHAWPSCG
jgi:hypothetical protein